LDGLQLVQHERDRAMVMLMLRCGLRVEEVARLKLAALDLRRSQIFVYQGKGALSDDAYGGVVAANRAAATLISEIADWLGRALGSTK